MKVALLAAIVIVSGCVSAETKRGRGRYDATLVQLMNAATPDQLEAANAELDRLEGRIRESEDKDDDAAIGVVSGLQSIVNTVPGPWQAPLGLLLGGVATGMTNRRSRKRTEEEKDRARKNLEDVVLAIETNKSNDGTVNLGKNVSNIMSKAAKDAVGEIVGNIGK